MIRLLRSLPFVLTVILALAGCGGGGGMNSSSGSSPQTSSVMMSTSSAPTQASTPASTSVVTTSKISGTVAVGAPLVGATVTLTDSRGATTSASTDANGHYECAVDGMTRPFLLHAYGHGSDMFSIAHDGDVMNANPVSDRIGRLAAMAGGTTPPALFDATSRQSLPTAEGMRSLTTRVMSGMARQLQSVGLDPATFDPTTTPFTADHMGFDGLLDHMQVTPDGMTIDHNGETVECSFRVESTDASSSTMTMTVTTTVGNGAPSSTTTSMNVPMHPMHGGPMMGAGK